MFGLEVDWFYRPGLIIIEADIQNFSIIGIGFSGQ